MLIRESVPDDAPALLAVTLACYPHSLVTEELIRGSFADPDRPPTALSLVAEVDGRVVASAFTGPNPARPGDGSAVRRTGVLPEFRCRGIGSALYERLGEHEALHGVRTVGADVTSPEGRAFAEHRGYAAGAAARISVVDPRLVPDPPPVPDGITLRPLAEIADRRPLFDLHNAAGADIPGERPYTPWEWEHWNRVAASGPILDQDASIVAYEDEAAVAMTFINTAGARAFNSIAGTLASHRGRGLAKLVKAASLRRAAEKGVTQAFTINDERNAPMLAVNTRLGYRPFLEQYTMTRTTEDG